MMKLLNRTACAVFLGLTLATMLGCAATPTRQSTGQYIDDAAITIKVKAAILDRPTLKLLDIHVDTFNGVVELRGIVASRTIMDEAVTVVRGVAGVRSVNNHMQVM